MFARTALGCALLAAPLAVNAQAVTFTVKDGRALLVGGETELGTALSSTNLDAANLVEAFDELCLPDPGGAGSRAGVSTFGLSPSETILPAAGKTGEARIEQWRSKSATLTVWTGDEANLKGRSIAMPSRATTTTGSYGPFKAFGTQCNLVTKVADFAAAKSVTEALTARYGAPAKLVVKNTFADGYWVAGNMRINVNVPTIRAGAQPLHLSAQALPE